MNLILTMIGSENCDSMFAIAALIAASMAAALGSLVMDTSNVGLICKPAESACGAAGAGTGLFEGTVAPAEGASPGSTTCTIGTGDRVMVLPAAPCAAAIRPGSSATAIRQTRIGIHLLGAEPVDVSRAVFGQLVTLRSFVHTRF